MTGNNRALLLNQYWSHVFNSPDAESVRLKNPRFGQIKVVPSFAPSPSAVILEAPEYVPLAWKHVGAITATVVSFLRKHGIKRGDRVAILSWNSPEWVWTDIAIQTLGAVTVPIYPNTASEQVNYILANAGVKILLADDVPQAKKVNADSSVKAFLFSEACGESKTYQTLVVAKGELEARAAADSMNTLEGEVSYGRSPPIAEDQDTAAILSALSAQVKGSRISAGVFNEVVGAGETPQGIVESDLASIIYTSGSTGVPKGVQITHGNIAASCSAVHDHGFDFNEHDLYLSYLPLAHCYERINGQYICLWFRVPVAFCKVEDFAKSLKKLRPTIVLGVPAIWRKIKDNIQAQLDSAKGIKKRLVNWALTATKPGVKRWFADLLVFRTIRAGLGGRLRIAGSGGGPISPELLIFFRTIGIDVIEGYGLTETCGAVTANKPGQIRIGTVGKPIASVQVKIAPKDGINDGSGEIYLKGGPVSPGYWQLPEDNAKTYDPEGWFKTGDLGRFDEEGNLKITGRSKRLLKTDGGKYVSPEKVEKAFDGFAIIQSIVPVGDACPFIGALIFVNPVAAKDLLREKGLGDSIPKGDPVATQLFLVKHPEVLSAIKSAVDSANTTLEHWETIKKFEVIEDEATVAGGLLTATLKIRTEEAMKRYADRVKKIYTKG